MTDRGAPASDARVADLTRQAAWLAERFGGFLDAAPDAIVVVNVHARILIANSPGLAMFGYTAEELIGEPVEILVPNRLRSVHASHRDLYIVDPHPRPMGAGLDLSGRRKDGTEFPVEISLSALDTTEGRMIIAAIRDSSERRKIEATLRGLLEALEARNRQVLEASRMKSEFLANMSHELRTPLNSVIGFAELMHDERVGPVSAEHKEFLGDILTSARHLLRLINDVLDLSKVESGRIHFFPEDVDIPTLVSELRDLVRTEAATKRIQIETEIAPTLTGVRLDPAKLKQVLYNYLSNALKFTHDGGRVIVRAMPAGDDEFRLEVEDNGIGIRAEDQDRLFQEFQQLDAGPAKKYQGTGLGLALTKRIVEAQGGRIGAQSAEGRGSLFYAVLPRIAPDPGSATE
jgi:PAS domain S-box-containing protein